MILTVTFRATFSWCSTLPQLLVCSLSCDLCLPFCLNSFPLSVAYFTVTPLRNPDCLLFVVRCVSALFLQCHTQCV
jgi:hypothetical protein